MCLIRRPLRLQSPRRSRATVPLGRRSLERIGNTPLLRLERITRDLPGIDLLGKAEWYNPGGSVKDRAAANIVPEARASGKFGPGKTLLDSTSGNTGIAYAMIGAAQGFAVTLCMPENVSLERKRILHAYGANIIYTDPATDPTAPSAPRANSTPRIPANISTPTSIPTTPTGRRTTMARPTKSGNRPKDASPTLSPCWAPAERSSAPRGG